MDALSINNLRKTYKNGVVALKGIDLNVRQGDFFALLGPNGAGKTTAIGIITSLVRKTSGSVRIFDTNIDDDFAQAKSYVGLMPQEFNFSVFEKVSQIVINQAGYYGLDRQTAIKNTEKYLKQLGLWNKRNDMARSLSGGMKRRLMIARALVNQPKLLILDEPTAGVDIELRRQTWDFLREINHQGTTIILTTHYLEEAEMLCKNMAIINHGKIIINTPVKTLLSQLDVETFVFDISQTIPADLKIAGFASRIIDDNTLEIDVMKSQSVNDVFEQLSKQGLLVTSMRNKVNRLEELFVRFTQAKENDDDNH